MVLYVFQAHLPVTPRATRCHPEPSHLPLADGGEGPAFRFLCFAPATEVRSGLLERRFGYAEALRFASAGTLDARMSTLLISGAFAKRSGALTIKAAATLPER